MSILIIWFIIIKIILINLKNDSAEVIVPKQLDLLLKFCYLATNFKSSLLDKIKIYQAL